MRATFITTVLTNGASLDEVHRAAGHADPRATKLYDHRQAQLTQEEIGRIRISGVRVIFCAVPRDGLVYASEYARKAGRDIEPAGAIYSAVVDVIGFFFRVALNSVRST